LARAGKLTEDGIGVTVNTVTPGYVATEMVEFTRRVFAERKVKVEVEFSWGATEAKAAEGLVERAANLGRALAGGLRALMPRQPMIGEVRGRGLAIGIELVRDQATREPVPVTTAAKVIYRAWQLGAVLFYVGLRGNVLELTPPLTLSDAEAEQGVAIIDQALTDVGRGLVADADVAPFMMW